MRTCGGIFDVEAKRSTLNSYEEEMADAAFWNDQEHARDIVQQVKVLKGWVEPVDSLTARIAGARELDELLELEPDKAMNADLDTEV